MEQKTFSPEELASYEKLFSSEELKRRITAEKDHQRADMFDDAESNRIDEDTLNGAIDSITDEDCKRVVIEDAIRHNDFGNHYDYDRDLVVPISEGNISALNTYIKSNADIIDKVTRHDVPRMPNGTVNISNLLPSIYQKYADKYTTIPDPKHYKNFITAYSIGDKDEPSDAPYLDAQKIQILQSVLHCDNTVCEVNDANHFYFTDMIQSMLTHGTVDEPYNQLAKEILQNTQIENPNLLQKILLKALEVGNDDVIDYCLNHDGFDAAEISSTKLLDAVVANKDGYAADNLENLMDHGFDLRTANRSDIMNSLGKAFKNDDKDLLQSFAKNFDMHSLSVDDLQKVISEMKIEDKLYGKKENTQTTKNFIEFIKQNNITIESKDSEDYQKYNLLNQAYELSPNMLKYCMQQTQFTDPALSGHMLYTAIQNDDLDTTKWLTQFKILGREFSVF